MVKTASVILGVLCLSGSLFAADTIVEKNMPKRSIKSSMKEVYHVLPQEADNLSDMFSQGVFYGRLRFNSFAFKWGNEEVFKNGKPARKDHAIAAVGGSIIYKSAYFNGFAFTLGVYGTEGIGSLDDNEAYLYKAGKGSFSRFDVLNGGRSGIVSIAQAYLEYKNRFMDIKAGRQIFESFLTASNDTKMIPNTFEGVTLSTKVIPDTQVKIAYLTREKLRDHSEFHHVLARGNATPATIKNVYSENDDTAVHFGLTVNALAEAGVDDRLFIIDAANKSVDNLALRMNYTAVPDIVSSGMIQADYTMNMDGFTVIPALRYMQQFDNGGGEIMGDKAANLKTVTKGYTDPGSLDSWMAAARVDVKKDAWKLRFGYSQIADEADLIAPWRGFPTAGFSRAMAQYNWYANTRTYMIRGDFDFGKAGLVPKMKAFMRYAIQDFDDAKQGVQADDQVITLDILKEIGSIPNLYLKFRMAHVWGDPQTGDIKKLDPSYDEARFEVNYLF